jgi:regulator of cell morphogenesis and NO signaling
LIDRDAQVATIVLEHACAASVFDRRHIDYCCEGHVPLVRACLDRGLDLDQIVTELDAAIDTADADVDPRTTPTSTLISRVLAYQHRHLRGNLALIHHEANNLARDHGSQRPVLRIVRTMVGELSDRLCAHLDEEEDELFPALLAGPSDQTRIALGCMFDEHREFSALLRRLRATTQDYSPGEDVGENVRALYRALGDLESLVLRHHHVENHVLLPRFR